MEDLNIVKGRGIATEYVVNSLFEGANYFYGTKYEKIIKSAINSTKFIELDENEKMNDISELGIPDKYENTKGLHINIIEGQKNVRYIIWKPTNTVVDYHIIAHELYGHAVCESISTSVWANNRVYSRNGIALTDSNGNNRFELINEGLIENIAHGIIETKGGIKRVVSNNYEFAEKCGKYLFNMYGKEKMLDIMVKYDYDLIKYFNLYEKLEKILKKELKTKDKEKIEHKAKKQLKKIKKYVTER